MKQGAQEKEKRAERWPQENPEEELVQDASGAEEARDQRRHEQDPGDEGR